MKSLIRKINWANLPLAQPFIWTATGVILELFLPILIHNCKADSTLTLQDFLEQVRKENPVVKGSLLGTQAGRLRSNEGELLLATTAFANAQATSDGKVAQFSFLGYSSLVTQNYSVGVSKITTFGLEGKVHYDLLAMYYNNPVSLFSLDGASLSAPITLRYTNASPIIEFTQHLWNNGFGRSTRATQTLLQAQALSSSYNSSYQAKTNLVLAEMNYWRLVLARQALKVQSAALDRANKIYAWNTRQARLQLRDKSDVLQAEALVQSRELDLLTAETEERNASRAFNSSRNIDSEKVQEQLIELDPGMIPQIRIPKRSELRDDVEAARQMTRASVANSEVASEKDLPTLDLFASFSLNGQQGYMAYPNLTQAMGASFGFNRPTETVGVKFSVPLDIGTTRDSREGWRQERVAAELNYDRKVFEQDQDWKNLNENFTESKRHLELSRKLELTQEAKLKAEQDRLSHGRTTTYQVLLFEQDYLLAQLIRIRDQANILNIIAQMKLFGETI